MKPFFSIIVPTLNRALTLKHCLRTIESQKLTDYEVIVSDNCSDDNTAEVTLEAQKTNPRIKYVRPDIQLPMSVHWEFAFEHATGSYVSFLGDDDGLMPSGLDVARQILIDHGMPAALNSVNVEYHWPNSPIKFHESLIRMPIGEAWVQERDSSAMLNMLKKHTRLYIELPMVYRGFVRNDVLYTIQQRTGRLIRSPIPDVYLALATAAVAPKYLFTNQSLFIEGVSGQSNGAATLLGPLKNDKSFFRIDGIPFHESLDYSPTSAFLHAESLLQCFDAGLLGKEMLMTPTDIVCHAAQLSSSLPQDRYDQSWAAISKLSNQHGLRQLTENLKRQFPNHPSEADPFPKVNQWIDSRNIYEYGLALRGDSVGVANVWDCAVLLEGFYERAGRHHLPNTILDLLYRKDLANRSAETALLHLKKFEIAATKHVPDLERKLLSAKQQLDAVERQLAETHLRLAQIEKRRRRLMQLLKQYHRGTKEAAKQLKKTSCDLFGSSRWKLGGWLTRPFSRKKKEPHIGLTKASKLLKKTISKLDKVDLTLLSGEWNPTSTTNGEHSDGIALDETAAVIADLIWIGIPKNAGT